MNASVAVVIVGRETNMTLSWTTNYPPVLLTDELSLSDDKNHDRCNNFGRVASKGTSRHICSTTLSYLVLWRSYFCFCMLLYVVEAAPAAVAVSVIL